MHAAGTMRMIRRRCVGRIGRRRACRMRGVESEVITVRVV